LNDGIGDTLVSVEIVSAEQRCQHEHAQRRWFWNDAGLCIFCGLPLEVAGMPLWIDESRIVEKSAVDAQLLPLQHLPGASVLRSPSAPNRRARETAEVTSTGILPN